MWMGQDPRSPYEEHEMSRIRTAAVIATTAFALLATSCGDDSTIKLNDTPSTSRVQATTSTSAGPSTSRLQTQTTLETPSTSRAQTSTSAGTGPSTSRLQTQTTLETPSTSRLQATSTSRISG
jgi:hypothetical protein